MKWALYFFAAALAGAQTPAAPATTFDVASVKPNKSGSTQVRIDVQPTTVTLLNMQLRPIIQLAWGINTPSRLAGIPDWANVERFDIIGKAESIPSREAMRPMLQALLVERLKLSARMEARQQPIYALVRARRDGALGPQLRRSTATCAGRGAPAPADAVPGAPVQCGPRPGGPGHIVLVGMTMQQWAPILSVMVGRTVVNRTGLDGLYDIDVTFTPDRLLPSPDGTPPVTTNDGPSLFTVLQEELGLKLEPETETVDVLVVEHVERPTEN